MGQVGTIVVLGSLMMEWKQNSFIWSNSLKWLCLLSAQILYCLLSFFIVFSLFFLFFLRCFLWLYRFSQGGRLVCVCTLLHMICLCICFQKVLHSYKLTVGHEVGM